MGRGLNPRGTTTIQNKYGIMVGGGYGYDYAVGWVTRTLVVQSLKNHILRLRASSPNI